MVARGPPGRNLTAAQKFGFQAPARAARTVDPGPAKGPGRADSSPGLSLRAKGLIVLSVLFVYMLVVLTIVALQWHRSLITNARTESLHAQETKIEMLQSSLSHAIINLQDAMKTGNPKDLDTDLVLLLSDTRRLEEAYPSLSRHGELLARDIAKLDNSDMASETVRALRANLEAMATEMAVISEDMHESKHALLSAHFRQQGLIAVIGIGMSLGGVALFGAMTTLFFNRLARDLKKLEARAMDIVTGYDGVPLEITRRDEVGGLMKAINRTQSELRTREKQLELSRQQRFYQEKMAAIGSLAAGVAHEINNPIAAISGIAQSISDNRASHQCSGAFCCRPELILEQTRRIAVISRELADLASTHSQEPDLLDLNGLIQRVSSFLGYDTRFRGIDVVLELDRDLPAVHSVADHLTQILMNLMINAADALENVSGRQRIIRIATRVIDDVVLLTVKDNGHGMDSALLSQVFDESFTTKPRDKGRGLGLFLCKSLIEQNGGRIQLESEPNVGTTARIVLPLQERVAA